MKNSFGKKLVSLKEHFELSRRKIGRDIGISYDSLRRYEKGLGTERMQLNHLILISKYFGWSIYEMIDLILSDEAKRRP